MKKYFGLAFLFFTVCHFASGQVIITKDDLPKIGQSYIQDTMSSKSVAWLATEFEKLSNTPSVEFDFSWLSGGNYDTVLFYNPDTTKFKDSFPDADIAMRQEIDFMMEINDSGLFVQGISLQGQIAKFDSALKYLPTPLSNGKSYYSEGSTVLNIGFALIYIDYERKVKAINYGTVKMPNDSTYDVLILDVQNDLRFDVVARVDTISSFNEAEWVYEFYSPDFGYPLIRGNYDPKSKIVQDCQFIDLTIHTALPNTNSNFRIKVYPNPSGGLIKIESEKAIDQLIITDVTGREIAHKSNLGNATSIEGLPSGIYQLILQSEGRTLVELLIVE